VTELTFGEQLRRLRRGKRWNLQDLSAASGISVSELSRIEHGHVRPGGRSLSRLRDALGGDALPLSDAKTLSRGESSVTDINELPLLRRRAKGIPSVAVYLRLDPELRDRLYELADKRNMTAALLFQEILAEWVEQNG
jgi:transcriptional regulator with XRE-family HTH domain